jgi:hypothetical protein
VTSFYKLLAQSFKKISHLMTVISLNPEKNSVLLVLDIPKKNAA